MTNLIMQPIKSRIRILYFFRGQAPLCHQYILSFRATSTLSFLTASTFSFRVKSSLSIRANSTFFPSVPPVHFVLPCQLYILSFRATSTFCPSAPPGHFVLPRHQYFLVLVLHSTIQLCTENTKNTKHIP